MAKEQKSKASSAIDSCKEELYQLSDELWRNPEVAYGERKAHALLTDFLEKKGFTVDRSYTGMETAFRATFGSGRPNICVICEYDALPEIGHACGHNLIAEAGVAAGLGLKAVLEASGARQAKVTILGTPAEEGGAGKVYLIKNGAFRDVDIAMMVHPTPVTIIVPTLLARTIIKVTYHGKAAHAAAFPWEGVNALDAAVMAYTSISALRQQMKPTWRVHGIITNGGIKPNIIPDKSSLCYFIRAPSIAERDTLQKKVVSCFEASALATGCQVDIEYLSPELSYVDVLSNPVLSKLFAENLKELGMDFQLENPAAFTASSDMGNVSHEVPSIHPLYAIGSSAVNHTLEFTAAANTPIAHKNTLVAAKAMVYTAIDVLSSSETLREVNESFKP